MSVVTSLRRFASRVLREAALYPALARGRGAGRRIAFLPSDGPVQSSMLRAYNIAKDLEKRGWATIVLPVQLTLAQRRRVLGAFRPDVVVVQQCRHHLNRPEYLADWTTVLDIDDADFLDPALTSVLERMARQAEGVICGSRYIRNWALPFNRHATVIWTTMPISPLVGGGAAPEEEPVVTWAQSSPLGYPNELEFVREVMAEVARRRGGVRLRLYGWQGDRDHPVLADLAAKGVKVDLLPFMPYDAFVSSLATAAVGLSPIIPEGFSNGKSFGKILAYLDARVPVICSDEVDHALFFTRGTGVVSNDRQVWVDEICRLLDDPKAGADMADKAYADYVRRLSTDEGGRLTGAYLDALLDRMGHRAEVSTRSPAPARKAGADRTTS